MIWIHKVCNFRCKCRRFQAKRAAHFTRFSADFICPEHPQTNYNLLHELWRLEILFSCPRQISVYECIEESVGGFLSVTTVQKNTECATWKKLRIVTPVILCLTSVWSIIMLLVLGSFFWWYLTDESAVSSSCLQCMHECISSEVIRKCFFYGTFIAVDINGYNNKLKSDWI